MIEGRQLDHLERPGSLGAGDRDLVAGGQFLGGQIGDDMQMLSLAGNSPWFAMRPTGRRGGRRTYGPRTRAPAWKAGLTTSRNGP
jgi:hypothetical protein